MKSPLLVLASCFALGIWVANGLSVQYVGGALLLAAVCLLCGLVLLRVGWVRASATLALLGFAVAGTATTGVFQDRFPPNDIHNLQSWGLQLNRAVKIEGIIVDTPMQSGAGYTFDLVCRKIDGWGKPLAVRGKVRIRLFIPPNPENWTKLDALRLGYGDAIRASVQFERPAVYKNPGNFNFRWRLQAIEDISWQGTIKSPLAIEKLAGSRAPKFWMLVTNVRARLLRGIDVLYPPWSREGRVGGVLKAALLGDRSSLDSTTSENFRQSGLYHLLVISGLNVALLASVIMSFLKLFPLKESWKELFLFIFLGVYALLVEQSAPTLRASLMIATYLLAQYLYRGRSSLNAVGFAALVLLLYRPAWLFEAGFQLSFLAALLIAGLAVPILERTTAPYRRAFTRLDNAEIDTVLSPRSAQFRLDLRALVKWSQKKFPSLVQHPVLAEQGVVLPVRSGLWVLELMWFSAVLQIGLLMPMAEIFHRITLVGVALNALAIPLMTLLLGLSAPTVLLAAVIPGIAAIPGRLLLWVTNGVLAVTEFRNYPPWLSYRVPGPPVWVAAGCGLAILALAWSLGRKKYIYLPSLAAFSLLTLTVVTYPFPPRIPKGKLEVTALDCGRGEALFAVLPEGTTVLVNAGGRESFGLTTGRWNPGEDIVSPYLWSRGIKHIDIVVLGSGSSENIRAMGAILRNFKVRELWRGPRVANPAYQNMADTARERGVAIREISQADQQSRGETILQALWPPLAVPDPASPLWDDAPVLRITSGRGSILWRGNTGDRVAYALAGSPGSLASDVLESARPLSDSPAQSRLLESVKPKVVVISGERNHGRAPRSFPVYQRLYDEGVRVLRTESNGAVTVEADGSHITVRCYRPPGTFD